MDSSSPTPGVAAAAAAAAGLPFSAFVATQLLLLGGSKSCGLVVAAVGEFAFDFCKRELTELPGRRWLWPSSRRSWFPLHLTNKG